MSILRKMGLGSLGAYTEDGIISGELDYLDFGGDGDGDGDGDSATVEITRANGASEDFPANAFPLEVVWYLDAVFAGGTIDSATIEMGDAGNSDQISGETAINVFTGQATGLKYVPGDDDAADGVRTLEAAYAPIATIATGTEPPAGLTAGKIRYMIRYRRVVFG